MLMHSLTRIINETVKLKYMKYELNVIVIESPEETETEWGISLDGHNPNPADYFKMIDKQTAFRLKDYLQGCFYETEKVQR